MQCLETILIDSFCYLDSQSPSAHRRQLTTNDSPSSSNDRASPTSNVIIID